MENKISEKELFNLEKKFWQAMKDKDVQAMLDLTDDPCIVAGASGIARVAISDFERMMKSATYVLNEFELYNDFKIKMLDENTAVIAYKARENLTVDGKEVSFEASEASTWVCRDGKWLCALHTESILGDPYGRDRIQKH